MISDDKIDYTYLLGYSSWNTAGNSIGIALSCGISRYMYLKNEPTSVNGANSAFVRSLALSFAKDVCYKQVKPQIDSYVAKLGGNADNFYGIEVDCEAICEIVQNGPTISFEKIAASLKGKHFLSSLAARSEGVFPEMYISDISFPWYRTFEVDLRIEISQSL